MEVLHASFSFFFLSGIDKQKKIVGNILSDSYSVSFEWVRWIEITKFGEKLKI